MGTKTYTVGHSNHSWPVFLALLRGAGIETLVDVRTKPMSAWSPFANRRTLECLLPEAGIEYRYMGKWLGGKPSDPSLYQANGKPDYRRMRDLPGFKKDIAALVELGSERTTAILCSEEDPTECHRRLMLGPAFDSLRCSLLHIRQYGRAQKRLGRSDLYTKQLQGSLL